MYAVQCSLKAGHCIRAVMASDNKDQEEDDRMNSDHNIILDGPPRVKIFLLTHTGPFVVSIREITQKLSPIKSSIYINKKYKTVSSIKQLPNKMKVTLNNRVEANSLIEDTFFKTFRVYAPAAEVEIDGVVSFTDLNDIDDLQDLLINGKGKFGNPAIGQVNSLAVKHLAKNNSASPPVAVRTNIVKITFAGCVLPSHLLVEGLLVKVRPFHRKAMFCENCLQFEHTDKYCHRKFKCARCEGTHNFKDCTAEGVDKSLFPYCSLNHAPNIDVCDHFKTINSCYSRAGQSKRHARYAEAVASVRDAAPDQDTNDNFPKIMQVSTSSSYASLAISSTAITPTNNRFSVLSETSGTSQQPNQIPATARVQPRNHNEPVGKDESQSLSSYSR